jgi:chromosome segregation ATPase
MKNFHQNLLIVLALGLCALCLYQWYDQTLERNHIEKLNQLLAEKSTAIQGYTNSLATMNDEIAQMDSSLTEFKQTAKADTETILGQKRDFNRLQLTSEVLTNQIAEYTNAVATLEVKLKDAYDGIKKQNAAMQELTAQRDDFVQKLNDSVKDRNDIVNKYNELVKQVEKQSGDENTTNK